MTEPWYGRFVRPQLARSDPYDATHHDYAWRRPHLERLMSNELPIPPDEGVLESIRKVLPTLHRYPDSGQELRSALASFVGVPPASVILGNGSTEIIDVATRVFVGDGDEAIIPIPTYPFFETQVRLSGGRAVQVPLLPGWRLDLPAIRSAIGERTKMIFLCSPNNPTGNSWSQEEVEEIASWGRPVLIDQAYLECGYGPSFAGLVQDHPNLIVARTMSKGFGLAGLRIGYGIADPSLVEVLLRVRIPFSLSLVALRAGLAALRDPSYVERRRAFVARERDEMFARLERLPGVIPYPSDGNFILIDVSGTGWTSAEIVAQLERESSILLRAMRAHGLEGAYVRVTIGDSEQNARFLEAFSRVVDSAQRVGSER
ncbi:MAG TPA: histidinol-phosphate transaminase [Actinomycetota bacterium]|nr:histidinol-phosphate transaminase [Actinomycetota bacterium]